MLLKIDNQVQIDSSILHPLFPWSDKINYLSDFVLIITNKLTRVDLIIY